MKCWCGAWTTVLSTRGDARRRECANLHRFTTREVASFDVCKADIAALARKRAALRLGGLKKGTINVSQERQDAVLAALAAGETQASIAKTQRISTKTIQKIKHSARICT